MSTDDTGREPSPKADPELQEAIELLRASRLELQAAMLAESITERRNTQARPGNKTGASDPWPH